MSEKTISIITVCRNAKNEINGLAASVLAALGPTDQWIVQDGASDDGTAAFFAEERDSRVRFLSQPDQGIYDALNRAMQRVSGDFVWILGVDDRPLVRCDDVRHLLQDPQTVYYGDVYRPLSDDYYAGPFSAARLARTNICQQAIFYPATLLKTRPFDLKYVYQADWVMNMTLFVDPTVAFQYVPWNLAVYGQQGASSMNMDPAFQADYPCLLKRYFALSDRWWPCILNALSRMYRALPGVPPARQRPARMPYQWND